MPVTAPVLALGDGQAKILPLHLEELRAFARRRGREAGSLTKFLHGFAGSWLELGFVTSPMSWKSLLPICKTR